MSTSSLEDLYTPSFLSKWCGRPKTHYVIHIITR